MSHTDAYEADLRGLVEELKNQNAFVPGDPEAWYDGIDEANVAPDYMMVNEAIVDILDARDGFNRSLKTLNHKKTPRFF